MAERATDRLVRTLWPSEAPVDEGRVVSPAQTGPPHRATTGRERDEIEARIAHPLAAIAAELHAIREQLAPDSGRPFSLPNGAVCDGAGAGVVVYDGPRPGNVWRVELIVVSVTGASAAGQVEAYVDTLDEVNLGGHLPALSGNNPSRGFLSPDSPIVVFGGNPFLVRILGAAAGASVTCRIQGENQEIGV